MLTLADLKGYSVKELIGHIVLEYDPPVGTDFKSCDLLVAYEHVGDYGCDSSSYFLYSTGHDYNRSKRFFEVHGSHCSCMGFEDQWEPQEVTKAYLVESANSEKAFARPFHCGGYDGSSGENLEAARQWIRNHIK